MDDERERDRRGRRRHRHPRRGLFVLHLEPLGRDRSRPSARLVLPRHAVRLRAAAHAQRHAARTARRDDHRPVQCGVRAAGPSVAVAPTRISWWSGAATSAAACAKTSRSRTSARRPRSARSSSDRRRLRRPVRGQGRPRPQAGQARLATGNGRITFTYERSTFTRATHVDFTGEPRISGSHVHYEVIVPPRGELDGVHAGHARDRRARDHAAPPVRPTGRALDAGRPARGVGGADCRSSPRRRPVPRAARSVDARRRRAAHLRPRVPRSGGGRGRRAVVHDAVRARLADHVVDDDARRPRPRARNAADARALPGREGRPAHRGGAGPHPARDALR